MRGLLVKDFRLVKLQKHFIIAICIIVLAIASVFNNTSFVFAFLIFDISMLSMSTIGYDEFDNGYPFLFTLPITRKEYVQEKYLIGLIFGMGSWVLALVISLITAAVKSGDFKEVMFVALIYIPVVLIMQSLVLPARLKYGPDKSRLVISIIIGIILVIFLAVIKILEAAKVDMEKTLGAGGMVPAIVFVAVSVVIFYLSYRRSYKIVENKEF